MTANDRLKEVAAALEKASRLLLLSHVSPDGDSLGSLLALARILEQGGQQVTVYVDGGIPRRYGYLPGAEKVVHDADQIWPNADTTVVVLDCGEWERVGLGAERFAENAVINIDHHRTTTGLGQVNYVDTTAAATGLLLYRLFRVWQRPIDSETATCLYTAIASDTGFFRYRNTTPETQEVAAYLLNAGAAHDIISDSFEERPLAYLKALGIVLDRLQVFADGKAALSYLTLGDMDDLQIRHAELDGFVNYPRSLLGVQVAAFLTEKEPGLFDISLRSRPPIDVSILAEGFGGGGHMLAAGCSIRGDLAHCLAELQLAVMGAF